jgi:histone deacetylase complex subunit SAP30
MAWTEAPLELLNTYRVVHNLPTPAAFTSPLRQALLTNPGIGRQSPTMARRKDKRRVSKKELGVAVRKHFNGAAINEIDVVVEMVYKVRNKGRRRMEKTRTGGSMWLLRLTHQSDKAFRMRSAPGFVKKP